MLTPGQTNGRTDNVKTYRSYRQKDDGYKVIGNAVT